MCNSELVLPTEERGPITTRAILDRNHPTREDQASILPL